MKAIETEYSGFKIKSTEFNGYRLRGDMPVESKRKMGVKIDYTGMVFSRLTVIEPLGVYPKSGYRVWGCICYCGKKVAIRARELKDGKTLSCGCLNRELVKIRGGRNKKNSGESSFNQLFYNYKRSSQKRGYDFELTIEIFKEIVEKPCVYCGSNRQTKAAKARGTFGEYFYTGIDRIDNKNGYINNNITPCCKQCNIAKGVLTKTDFFNWIRSAYTEIFEQVK